MQHALVELFIRALPSAVASKIQAYLKRRFDLHLATEAIVVVHVRVDEDGKGESALELVFVERTEDGLCDPLEDS